MAGMYEWRAVLENDGALYEVAVMARDYRDAVSIIMANYPGMIIVWPHHD